MEYFRQYIERTPSWLNAKLVCMRATTGVRCVCGHRLCSIGGRILKNAIQLQQHSDCCDLDKNGIHLFQSIYWEQSLGVGYAATSNQKLSLI